MRIYRYILTSDTGMAPSIDDGLVSLATCKPVIRRCAQPGDWVIGFLASPVPSGMVAWAGRVSRFGDRPRMLPESLSHLAAFGQGHLVNGIGPADPRALSSWLRGFGPPGLYGDPPDRDPGRSCGKSPRKACSPC